MGSLGVVGRVFRAASSAWNGGCVGDGRAVDDVESSPAVAVAGSASRVVGGGAAVAVVGQAGDGFVDVVGALPSASSACAVSSGKQAADIGQPVPVV